MNSSETIEVCLTHWNGPAGVELRAAQRAEIKEIYGDDPGPAPSAESILVFTLLKIRGNAVACGGLRPLAPLDHEQVTGAAEIKRMFVMPPYRGSANNPNVASLLLGELERQATASGWNTLRLETGAGMTKARSFYERHGYKEIPLFGHYIGVSTSVCYEKILE